MYEVVEPEAIIRPMPETSVHEFYLILPSAEGVEGWKGQGSGLRVSVFNLVFRDSVLPASNVGITSPPKLKSEAG